MQQHIRPSVMLILFAVNFKKHMDGLERLRRTCSQIVGHATELSNTTGSAAMASNIKDTAHVDFHVSLSHTQPAAYTQRKTLLKGLRKAFNGWRSLNIKLDAVQVGSLTNLSHCCE